MTVPRFYSIVALGILTAIAFWRGYHLDGAIFLTGLFILVGNT